VGLIEFVAGVGWLDELSEIFELPFPSIVVTTRTRAYLFHSGICAFSASHQSLVDFQSALLARAGFIGKIRNRDQSAFLDLSWRINLILGELRVVFARFRDDDLLGGWTCQTICKSWMGFTGLSRFGNF
jgi:hypothetical protein